MCPRFPEEPAWTTVEADSSNPEPTSCPELPEQDQPARTLCIPLARLPDERWLVKVPGDPQQLWKLTLIQYSKQNLPEPPPHPTRDRCPESQVQVPAGLQPAARGDGWDAAACPGTPGTPHRPGSSGHGRNALATQARGSLQRGSHPAAGTRRRCSSTHTSLSNRPCLWWVIKDWGL